MSEPGQTLFSRRPALVALAFLVAGILLSTLFRIPYYYPLVLTAIAFWGALYCYFRQAPLAASIFLAATMALLGWHLGAVSRGPFPPNHIANIVGEGIRTEIAGRVVAEPDVRPDKTYLTLEADSLRIERAWAPTLGRVRVRATDTGLDIDHDDYLKIAGFLYQPAGATNPTGFDYAAYLVTREIFAEAYVSNPSNIMAVKRGSSFLSSAITPIRQKLISISKRYLPPDKSSMLTGFILGERREMPEEYQRLFRDTGTMHLMAVSGSNVGMVLLIFGLILSLLHLPKSVRAVILLFIVGAFALLTRLEPSVIRASIMAAVGITAYGWMRKPDLINLLAFAGLLMLFWHPLQLFDAGFQLSFAAAFGIIFALPRLSFITAALDKRRLQWLRWPVLTLLGTVAAQVAVLPLVARYFHNIPALGAIANIPVILLAGVAIALGIALFAFSAIGGWFPLVAAIPLGFVLDIIIAILKFFASLPHAKMASASFGWAVIILFWISAYLIFELAIHRRLSKAAFISALVILNVFIWGKALEGRQDWRIEFPDLRRNHAWVFSAEGRPTIACFDSYEPQDDAENVIIPLILNRHVGRLDYLLSVTPNSPEVSRVASEFGAQVISFEGDRGRQNRFPGIRDIDGIVSASGIKVLWDRSDNTNAGSFAYPAIEIDVDGGVLILAGWAGMTNREKMYDSNIRLIELPWSQYARSACLEILEQCDPDLAVFSPDRYSVKAPTRRDGLTHSREKTISTSLCGAIALGGRGGAVELETMKPRK